MEKFDSIVQFYSQYNTDKSFRKLITLDDIERLAGELRDAGYYVKEYKNGAVAVKTPDDLKAASYRRRDRQRNEAAKYTKLRASIPIPLVQAFSVACRILGISQSDILMPLILDTIKKASQLDSDV